ncbi:hypothetical protein KD050_11970 [Psychrobacillus sp. INOP01]|uniref:BsuPI-related putative proteinase inhibitor n=1 Tax=Psychrobacillus sp. INOP01 TaxID=2829187 RepID=UPI001BABB7CF|nr:BsuPI-related putative proteinase inhibitor [Psychrobacillus sp. INOP01]QUG40035.1 hypothetical protein KD050_11970 [Psychrobacillus sp. INOP01]
MRSGKRISWFLLFAIPLFILASCGSSTTESTKGSEVTEEHLSTRLDLTGDGEGSFTIKNESSKEAVLEMSSGQQIEFQLLNKANAVIYTYSANKLFIQEMQEKKLQSGEEWTIPLNLEEELAGVPPGSYTLVVWSTAEGLNEQKEKMAYEILTSPGKLVVQTQEVTFTGLVDSHSIEVKNLDGGTEVMQLSEVAMPLFENLEDGTQIIIEYVEESGQKVVQTMYLAE